MPRAAAIRSSSVTVKGEAPLLFTRRVSVECDIPVSVDIDRSERPELWIASPILSAIFAEKPYGLLSIWIMLFPIWGTVKAFCVQNCVFILEYCVFQNDMYNLSMDMNQAVAKAVAAERAIAGLTVRELSTRADIPLSTLMRILGAEREIKVTQLMQLATAFGVTPADLVMRAQEIRERAEAQPLPVVDAVDTEDLILAAKSQEG